MRVVTKNRKTENSVLFCRVVFFCVWNFSSGILYYISPRVEHALLFFIIYFLRVERDLVICITFFYVWNALW